MSIRSLYAKLAAILLGVFCAVGVLFIAVVIYTAEMYQKEVSQKLNTDLARNIVAETDLLVDGHVNESALPPLFHDLMVINPSIELYLLDPRGRILAFSAPPGRVRRERVDTAPVETWLGRRPGFPFLGDDPRDPQGKKPFSAARIPPSGPLEGYLYIILGGEDLDSAAQRIAGSYILQIGLWWVLAGLLFGLAAALILFFVLTRRLRRLTTAVDAFRNGRPAAPRIPPPVEGKRPDEIDRLGLAFLEMAGRIEDQMGRLRRSDELRRELMANVSHDLRTPLTTLQGYIESILMREESVSPEGRRRYLETALKHCGKLNRLVAELFELAKLDSGDIRPAVETFHLGELAGDLVHEYRLRAEERGVPVRVDLSAGAPLIRGDPGMIERVLENLLDNALRHTPPPGEIVVEISEGEGTEVTVRVRDTGDGIPPVVLPRIFDRFYRTEDPDGPGPQGSGLGLSIVKRILDLHGTSITVESIPARGTVFTFTLPRAEV